MHNRLCSHEIFPLRVCYKLQNLHLADTFISLSVRSICFCLYSHFSALSLSVNWIFSLPPFVFLTLTSFHLLILSFHVVLPSSFLSFILRAALFLISVYSSAFAVYLRVTVCLFRSLEPSHLFVLWGFFCTEDSLVPLLRLLQLLWAFMWSFSLAPAECM